MAQGREGDGRRDADGQPGPLRRGPPPDRRVDQGRRDRHRARGARLERRRRRTASSSGRARDPRPSPQASTGTSGSARAPTGLTPARSRRSSGAGCGTSATAPCPTWRRTTSIPAFNALGLDTPDTIEVPRLVRRRGRARPAATCSPTSSPPLGDRGPLKMIWYDNGLSPPTRSDVDPDDPRQRLGEGDNGLLLRRRKGIITCAGWSGMPRLLPLSTAHVVPATREDDPARRRPPRRLAPGLQGRHAGVQQLRVRRPPDRDRPPRHARAADGQGDQVGRGGHEGRQQRAGGAAVHRGTYRKGWELRV